MKIIFFFTHIASIYSNEVAQLFVKQLVLGSTKFQVYELLLEELYQMPICKDSNKVK